MKIEGSIALVTGANRGIGRAFAQALLDGGALKVYAGARDPSSITAAGLVPVKLDITSAADVAAAALQCADVNLLINNAGVADFVPLLEADSMASATREMQTNYFGTLAMCRAFAPVLKKNGGGALVNMLSVASLFNAPMQGSYAASKAASYSMTNGIRFELRAQKTLVLGIYAGYVETDMTAAIPGVTKSRPEEIAAATMRAIEAGVEHVYADERAESIRVALGGNPQAMDENMQMLWDKRAKARATGR